MKRWLLLILAGLILGLSLSACSAASDRSADEGYENSDGLPAESGGINHEASGEDPASQISDRRVIRNASLTLIASDVKNSYEKFAAFVSGKGGYELQQTTHVQNEIVSIDAKLRVPPEHLDACLDYAAELGELRFVATDTEDITVQYFDAQTRLKSMETALERYYDYLDEAASIEESLSVQSQINQLTLEIEQIKGRLQLWQNQLKESTITLALRQLNDPVQTRREISWKALSWSDMGYLMSSGLRMVASFVVNALQWIAVILVASAPIWIPVLVILLIVRRRVRRRRRQQTGLPPQQPDTAVELPEVSDHPDEQA